MYDNYYIAPSSALTSIADAIREKGGTSSGLVFPNDFVTAIAAIPSGLTTSDALIIATVPTGSTVTATKGGVTLTPTIWTQSADNTLNSAIFSIPSSTFDANAWTVAATLNGDTASDTVVINSAKEYSMKLAFRVPLEYTEVEFLQSSGTQYIATPIPANTVNSGTIDFMSTSLKQWAYIYGASSTTRADPGGLGFSTAFGGSTPYKYGWVYDSQYNSTSVSADTNVRHTAGFHYLSNNIEYMLDGEIITTSHTAETYTITTNSIYLFAMNYNNGTISNGMKVNAKVYSFKLYNSNGDIILDCRPCYRKSDSVAGMWDRVSKIFLTNQGTGTFFVGGDVS